MDGTMAPYEILTRWPPKHGYWYLACVTSDSAVHISNPIHPDDMIQTTKDDLGRSNIRPYLQGLGGMDLKDLPCADPLQKDDCVLARVHYSIGCGARAAKHEMGQVLKTEFNGGVLIEFEYGVKEVVNHNDIYHMHKGGPTRLNHAAHAIYPRRTGPPNHVQFSVSRTVPPRPFVGVPVSALQSDDIQSVETLIAVVHHQLDNIYYNLRPAKERQGDLLFFNGRYAFLPESVKASPKGAKFRRLWVQLTRHHHHNLPPGAGARIPLDLNETWFDA